MTILWTQSDADLATGFSSSAPWQAQGVSIDTRNLQKGDLYIALRGANHDGHDFLDMAVRNGASALLIDKKPKEILPIPFLLVKDTLEALQKLGLYARNRTRAQIIGITGSVGKTSTKEALYIAFSSVAKTIASQGGLNNHWGLPLSLTRIPEDIDVAILEMGMNHKGELHELSLMAKPHLAIITKVAEAHREFFTSLDEIVDAKCEILDGVPKEGTIILNRDCLTFDRQFRHVQKRSDLKFVTFGSNVDSDIRLMKLVMEHNYCEVQAQIFGKTISYALNTNARHLAFNSLAVLAAVSVLGFDVDVAAKALQRFAPLAGRGKQELIHYRKGSFLLIDESYNASPVAVKAALNVLGNTKTGEKGRRIFVFGDMRELGEDALHYHADLAQNVISEDIDVVFSCGTLSKALFEAIPEAKRGGHKADAQELAQELPSLVEPGDVVMVKGSLSMQMKKVVDSLKSLQG